jgi:hypothetical protein
MILPKFLETFQVAYYLHRQHLNLSVRVLAGKYRVV